MIEHSRRVLWALPAVVLTGALVLAGCSSSNRNMAPREPTELEKAQTATMATATGAREKSDEAAMKAEEAKAALTDLAEVQAGSPGAAMHADAAAEAAAAAKAAYDTARVESGKAANAATVTAAVIAKLAAEEAGRTAEAQAAMAAEKAQMAKDTAAMEVRHVEGMTYRVGVISITAGAPNENFAQKRRDVTSRGPVRYTPAAGGNAEVPAQPGVNARRIAVGTLTLADNANARLFLVDKYVGNKSVKVYRKAINSSNALITRQAAITPAHPDGGVDHDGSSSTPDRKVMRATGEFYSTQTERSQRFDKTNANDNIPASSRDANATVGVYYYEHPDRGKVYMLRTGSTNDLTKFIYQELLVYDFDKFPVAVPYEHMNFGMWHPLGNEQRSGPRHGLAFVKALPGKGMTPMADMPNNGTATYTGPAYISARKAASEVNLYPTSGLLLSSETAVDFGRNTVDVTVDWPHGFNDNSYVLAKFKGTITGNRFSGTTVSNVVTSNAALATVLGLTPSQDGSLYTVKEFHGAFFGPSAPEVGGVFDVTSENNKNGAFRGVFGGRK